MESHLTTVNDIDLIILNELNDEALMQMCQTNVYFNTLCVQNDHLKHRLNTYLKGLKQDVYNVASYDLLLASTIDAIQSMCQTNKSIQSTCYDKHFWIQKFEHDHLPLYRNDFTTIREW